MTDTTAHQRGAGVAGVAIAVGLAVALMGASACSDNEPQEPPRDPASYPTTLAQQGGVALGDDLTTQVPSQACAECHADVVKSYASSGMQHSLTLPHGVDSVEAQAVGSEVVDAESGIRYQLGLEDGHYIQRLRYVDPSGVERAHYITRVDLVVGSGHKTRSYFQVKAGRVFELPVTWYPQTQQMGLSPGAGFRQAALRFATRQCVGCHTGVVEPRERGRERGFRGTLSLGISCDRCHGDGTAHSQSGDPAEIVAPRKLSLQRQTELCYQCHLSGALSILRPNSELPEYQPGTPLGEVVALFDGSLKNEPDEVRISGHGKRMQMSLCFKKRSDLTCTTCHNPHLGHRSTEAATESRTGCFVCHTDDDCGTAHGERNGRTCASCHMATRPSSDIEHTHITDHYIQRRPPSMDSVKGARPGQIKRPRIAELAFANVPLHNQFDPDDQLPGAHLAKAQAYQRAAWEARPYGVSVEGTLSRAVASARRASKEAPDDLDTREVLGIALLRGGEVAEGMKILDELLAEESDREEARLAMGMVWADAGKPARAVAYLQPAFDADPYSMPVGVPLAQSLHAAQRTTEALDLLDGLRDRIGPSSFRAQLGMRMGREARQFDRAVAHGWDVLLFAPRDPEALTAVADLLTMAREPAATAQSLLQEALRLHPRSIPAMVSLAELQWQAGRNGEAREWLARARALAPRHPRVQEASQRIR